MVTKEKLRLVLLFAIAGGLFLYHLSNLALSSVDNPDITMIMKIVQLVTVSITTILFLNSPLAARLARDLWIAGNYEGQSQQANPPTTPPPPPRRIVFHINQNVFQLTIVGQTYDDQTLLYTWRGRAYDVFENEFKFALDVTSVVNGTTEYGILQYQFNNNQMVGTYHSGHPTEPGSFREITTRTP